MNHTRATSLAISEIREFASFNAAEQRYIRRSLDIGFNRRDAFKLWARDASEIASIRRQYHAYRDIPSLRLLRPDDAGFSDIETLMGRLMPIAAFDLAQERISSFSAFRFLYERLLGAWARPWLPGAFCGASALPQIRPGQRKVLLHSISEAAATAPAWSDRDPCFLPEWIEQETS